MCVYCFIGDHTWKYNPPFPVSPFDYPTVPQPVVPGPITPWPLEQLKEYLEVLKEVKALEDKLGCPCLPNKADYIKMLKDKIAELEKTS